ncbi:protein PBDC1-like isoform X2 [Hydractinia symbiolongicarpus]|uniref:protein PBDC1-like isoform X2 n=1 Tax=Hydractinia symbiolongicarpus TaxID=13093 RepID=UPI0025514601|nr:protein PBDC1-like isoform X2 [Hydractinia symbiolongicarpus]
MADLASQLDSLGANGALAAGSLLQADASQFGNNEAIESYWAMKAHKHAEVYMKLISSIDPKNMKLTKFDDVIYRSFKRYFKDLNIEMINENDLKTEEAKARWRPFCEMFKDKVDDYNFGTLLRKNVKEDYTEENCFLVTRIQFFAIELARNKRGLNMFHLKKNEANNNEQNKQVETVTDGIKTINTDGSEDDR